MHAFQLSEDQVLIQETVRKFAQETLRDAALEHDEHRDFVTGPRKEMAELGLFGLALGEESGGAGMGMIAYVVALEEVGGECGSSGRLLLEQAGKVCPALEGLEEAGELLGAVAMGETLVAYVGPEAGVRCSEDGDGLVLQGRADLVVGGGPAEVVLVAATDGDGGLHLVRMPAEAAAREEARSLGFRAAGGASLGFEGVRVGAGEVLARGEAARAAVDRADRGAWLGSAALCEGIARRSLELARAHAAERIAFGKPLLAQQAVIRKLGECDRLRDAARHQTWDTARLLDAGEDATVSAMRARISAIDAAVHSADEAIQIMGGYGFTVEYHVERHYRDAMTLEVLDGGSNRLRQHLAERWA